MLSFTYVRFLLVVLIILAASIIQGGALLHVASFDGHIPIVLSGLPFVSACYFFALLFLSLLSRDYFFFFMSLVVITVPNAVNDLLPNMQMGPSWERNSSGFSIFTHIDIFCVVALIRYRSFLDIRQVRFPTVLLVLMLVFLFVKVVEYFDSELLGVFLAGLYQIKYLAYCVLLVTICNERKYFEALFLGLCVASVFLVFESVATTIIKSGGLGARLGSGNFAVNVYGNFLAGLIMMIGVGASLVARRLWLKLVCYAICCVLLCALWLTGTRSSLVAVFVSAALVFLLVSRSSKLKSIFIAFSSLAALSIFCFFSYRYALRLSDAGLFDGSYIYDENFSSINTRLTLWQITIQMIIDHYFSGVGNLVWNFMKYDYGSPFDVLLDPHSDYLNYLVSYGLFLGGGIIFYFFAKPLLKSLTLRREFRYRRTWLVDYYFVFFAFLLPVCISSFSNSNTMKHQLFFIFCFAALTCLQLSRSIVYDSSRQDI